MSVEARGARQALGPSITPTTISAYSRACSNVGPLGYHGLWTTYTFYLKIAPEIGCLASVDDLRQGRCIDCDLNCKMILADFELH
jgi:hypothetical protein